MFRERMRIRIGKLGFCTRLGFWERIRVEELEFCNKLGFRGRIRVADYCFALD